MSLQGAWIGRVNDMTQTKGAILYLRVSSQQQVDEGTSLASQEQVCLKKAADLGIPVVAIIRDEGVSGALYTARPGIQRALSELESGRASVLICATLTRSGRDVDINRAIRKRVQNAGGTLIFADGLNFENTAVGNFMFTNMAGVSELERELIRERTMAGRKQMIAEGKMPYRNRSPMGYHIVMKNDVVRGDYPAGTEGTYQIVEHEATIIAAMFNRAWRGDSLRSVCTWLMESGVPPHRGGSYWYPSTLRGILRNPCYKGEALIGRKRTEHDEGLIEQGYKLPYRRKDRDPAECYVLACPAIVSVEVWEAVQRRLAGNQAIASGNPNHGFALTGLLCCPVCGSRLQANRVRGNLKATRNPETAYYYRCVKVDCEAMVYVRGPAIEHAVAAILIRVTQSPDMLETARATYQQITPAQVQELADIPEKLKAIEREEQALIQAQLDTISHGGDAEPYARRLGDTNLRKSALRARQEQLRGKQQGVPSLDAVAKLVDEGMRHALLSPSVPALIKRQVYSLLVAHITPPFQGRDGVIKLHPFPLSTPKLSASVYTVSIYYTDGEQFRVVIA